MGDQPGERSDWAREGWGVVGRIVAAHVVMLRDGAVLDAQVAAAIVTALDGVSRGEPIATSEISGLILAFDDRLDVQTPAGAVGAARVGRGRAEVTVAAIRLLLRQAILDLVAAANATRRALLDLADAHMFTLMPAYADGQPVQPTTLAHHLGGVVAPLGRGVTRLVAAHGEVNWSPLGAVALASTGFPIARERTAALLGFDGVVPNTFDALSASDYLVATVEATATVVAPLRRWLDELLTWRRTDPDSLRFGEAWLGRVDPGLPAFRPALGVETLIGTARRIDAHAASVVRLAHELPYGVTSVSLEIAFELAYAILVQATQILVRTTELVESGLEVNRAYLASRAGRDHITSGELSDFLMTEAGLDPAAARAITLMTVRKAREEGREAGGIDPTMIDASALMVIGRELGIEIEHLGRVFAPRRVLERRLATGAPSAPATRDYLEFERTRLLADERWRDAMAARAVAADRELRREMDEIVAAVVG